jgi:ankyrin repeat protein
VKLLIAKGADVNAKADSGDTPLRWAGSLRNNEDIVNALRQAGAKE